MTETNKFVVTTCMVLVKTLLLIKTQSTASAVVGLSPMIGETQRAVTDNYMMATTCVAEIR